MMTSYVKLIHNYRTVVYLNRMTNGYNNDGGAPLGSDPATYGALILITCLVAILQHGAPLHGVGMDQTAART